MYSNSIIKLEAFSLIVWVLGFSGSDSSLKQDVNHLILGTWAVDICQLLNGQRPVADGVIRGICHFLKSSQNILFLREKRHFVSS